MRNQNQRRDFQNLFRPEAPASCRGGAVLDGLLHRMDARRPETAAHCRRVAVEAGRICDELDLPADQQALVILAALFHDVGKAAVPEDILRKKGGLTGEEFEAVKLHPEKTREILGQIDWPAPLEGLPEVAGGHHERWDGSGYPRGLAGADIPLGARVIGVADAFDALTSRRRYREPMTPRAAAAFLADRSGAHFDPAVTDAFLRRRCAGAPRRAGYTHRYFCRTSSFSRRSFALPW
jgi:putative nucleotidyltransferase with HDIG domain